jgi:DNA-binding NarL/FixJ family response regulator
MAVNIVVAEQMDLALEGIKAILNQQKDLEVMGTYQTFDELIDGLTELRPQVILLGDRLEPGMDVLALVERVQRAAPRAQVIVMSSTPDGLIVHDLLAMGVTGYLYRGDPLSGALVEAIQTVMRKRPYLSPTANAEYLLAMQSDRAGWQLDAEAREILRLMASGYRPQEIALLRGMFLRRVYWIVNKLRDRFGAETNEHMIARAAEEGFLP